MLFRRFRQLFVLLFIQSLVTFIIFFLDRSEVASSIVLWFSKDRLMVVIALLIAQLSLGVISYYLFFREKSAISHLNRLFGWMTKERLIVLPIIIAFLILMFGITITLIIVRTPNDFSVYGNWAPTTFPTIKSSVITLLPVIINGFVTLIEITLYWVWSQRAALSQKATWVSTPLGAMGLFLIIVLSLFQWCVLVFRLRIFVKHPAWYWEITSNPITIRDGLFLIILLLLLLVVPAIFTKKAWLGTLGLLLITLSIQFAIGYLGENGFISFQDRIFTTYHSAYAHSASRSSLSLLETVRNYESYYGHSMFTSTKPPGLMVFYQVLERMVNGQPGHNGMSAILRYDRMKWLITVLFPLLACGAPLLLLRFLKKFFDPQIMDFFWQAPVLFVVTPNFVLFALFADQALYPGLFFLGVWLITTLLSSPTYWKAFLIGVLLYIFVFFAFTMLPLFSYAAFFLLMMFWTEPGKHQFKNQILLGVLIIAGTISMHAIGKWLLNYDVIQRFIYTMNINHNFDFYTRVGLEPMVGRETLWVRVNQIVGAMWINNLEFASAVGFGLWAIFVVGAARLLMQAIRRKIDSSGIILVSMLLSFLMMNLLGTAQGEVARLWLFWLPMVIGVAAKEIHTWRISYRMVYVTLVFVQLVNTLLTFHFQDLHM